MSLAEFQRVVLEDPTQGLEMMPHSRYIYYIFLRGILGCRMDASCQRIWPTKGESQSRGIVAFPAIFMDAIKYGDPHGTFMPFRSAECEEESKTLFSLAQVLHY